MKLSYLCMLITVSLPYIWVGIAKFARRPDGTRERYDNHQPRAQQAQFAGLKARALWAQNNAFEALPAFLGATLLALHSGVPHAHLDTACLIFVLARISHGLLYLADMPTQRSIAWFIGFLAVVDLFVQSLLR